MDLRAIFSELLDLDELEKVLGQDNMKILNQYSLHMLFLLFGAEFTLKNTVQRALSNLFAQSLHEGANSEDYMDCDVTLATLTFCARSLPLP